MSISKYGKTYDASDGSEQSFDGANEPRVGAQRGAQIGRERWADDGGPANDSAPLPSAPRPAWSVLSAPDLDAAIRQERLNDPPAVQCQAERAERRAADSRARAADRDVEAARAQSDRYRNAWENT